MSAAPDFNTQLLCVRCGQQGHVTWARNSAENPGTQTATSPVSTSDGFYLRINKRPTSNPQIVCTRCDTVQSDRVV